MRRRSVFGAAMAILAAGAMAFPAQGQDFRAIEAVTGQPPRPAEPPRGDMGAFLARMNYDPSQNGPLIVVAPDKNFPMERALSGPDKPPPALGSVAAAFGRKIINAGRLTVLAPREAVVINTTPDKARLMDNLEGHENYRRLFATLSEAQWIKACSEGLTLADMTPEQKPIFDKMLPQRLRFRKYTVKTVELSPGSRSISYEGGGEEPIEMDRAAMRLRFSWSASLILKSQDKSNSYYIGGAGYDDFQNGQSVYLREYYDNNPGDRTRAFGVPIVAKVPNRLKHGELDFADAALNPPVGLTPDAKTVGDVLKAVSAALNLEIVADRRVAGLPVVVRVAPGSGVRAGDILEGLAWSISGAYRRMGARMFLLTYDVEGIGTQWMRVKRWADEANQDKWRQLEKGIEQAAKRFTLSPLRFAPGDARALSPDMMAKIMAKWKRGETWEGIEMETSALSAPLREEMQRTAKSYEGGENSVSIRTDKVGLNLQMVGQWIPPNGERINGLETFQLDNFQLARFLNGGKTPTPPTPANAEKPKRYFDAKLTRRALYIGPITVEEAETAVTAAKKAGFTELWVTQRLDQLDDVGLAPLNAAIAAGKKAGMPVYAVAALLKNVGVGELDLNLLGQTGDEFAETEKAAQKRRQALEPAESANWTEWMSGFLVWQRGWVAPTPEVTAEVAKRAAKLAQTPGLAGLALRDSTPPGYYVAPNAERYGGMEAQNGGMGYTLANRLAFFRAEGIDPVDLAPLYINANVDTNLPFFPTDDFQTRYTYRNGQMVKENTSVPPPAQWADFRDKQSLALLAAVYEAVHKAAPELPLYQDTRQVEFIGYSSYFGSFDAPDQTPRPTPYGDDKTAIQTARAASKTVLTRIIADPGVFPGTPAVKRPEQFAEKIGSISAQGSTLWDGLVSDTTLLPFRDLPPLLSALEPTPKGQ